MKNLLLTIMFCAVALAGYVLYFTKEVPEVIEYAERVELINPIELMRANHADCGTALIQHIDRPPSGRSDNTFVDIVMDTEKPSGYLDTNDVPNEIDDVILPEPIITLTPQVDSKAKLKQAMMVLNNLKAEYIQPVK